SFEPTKKNVKIIGRANYQDGYLWVGLTDAGIEYKINGKTTTINVTADTTAYSEDMPARIIIYADDDVYLDTVITQKNTDFTVDFKRPGKHVVRFIKVSEAERGSIRINEIKSDSKKISPTAPAKLKMEFIGDSITCAYGVDGTGFGNFSTRTQDGTKSYAFKTAQKFHADYSIVAYSGFSILSCVSFDGGRTPNSTVPPIYDRLGFSFAPNEFDDGTFELQSATWDQQQYIPDLVVINLGTNDNSYFQSIDPSKVPSETEAFIKAYEDFLSQIRDIYPKAKILCTLGMMGQEVFPQIEEAVSNYISKTGDKRVKTFKLSVQNEEKNGLGIDGHPSAQSHVDATKELVGAIEKLFGW
ncbi:carbohydrate esterase family 2 protein, partial [Piromyces sp. E2]